MYLYQSYVRLKYPTPKHNTNEDTHHDLGSTLRRFASGGSSPSALGTVLWAGRFSFTGGRASVAAFGFFFTTTPFKDFFMSFLTGTILPLSEVVSAGLGVCVDNVGGRGLLVAFPRAATALIKIICIR